MNKEQLKFKKINKHKVRRKNKIKAEKDEIIHKSKVILSKIKKRKQDGMQKGK